MYYWKREDWIKRIGLAPYGSAVSSQSPDDPIILGKTDVDPVTRGMNAVISQTVLDSDGGQKLHLKYWYRRPNGQSRLVHLFDLQVNSNEDGDIDVTEIFYKNKPILESLTDEQVVVAREILSDAIKDVHMHLREGGSPKEIIKILHDANVPDIIGEEIRLPGVGVDGEFSFPIADNFNAAAQGELSISNDAALQKVISLGEINTLDQHRNLLSDARVFGTQKNKGTTFSLDLETIENDAGVEVHAFIKPHIRTKESEARSLENFLSLSWNREQEADADGDPYDVLSLAMMGLINKDLSSVDTDTKIRGLGIYYKIMEMIRRQRFPKVLDYVYLYDYLQHCQLTDPVPMEGRLTLTSYLGNGNNESDEIEGFGGDLGACKVFEVEYYDENNELCRENVIFDAGMLLPPRESDYSGALPDVISSLRNCKGIFISHRHLDHMAALVTLARLGVLKNIPIYGSSRALYILEQQMKAEIDDKALIPRMSPLKGESSIDFDRISVEYSVDAMEHSTPASAYRAVGRKTREINNLKLDDLYGSYFFYGDGRRWRKPEFAERGLRNFGIERQDTLIDVDITNAKKPGHAPTEVEATKNRQDLVEMFPGFGILLGMISTNDTKLNTYYDVFTHTQRNFTAVGHNIEMTVRSHNIHGVDPEYIEPFEKDNVNEHLMDIARKAVEEISPDLWGLYHEDATELKKRKLFKNVIDEGNSEVFQQIKDLGLLPVQFRGRTSGIAKSWLLDVAQMAILVTGTQGNPAELFATLSKLADGVSILDTDRHTGLKIEDPSQWIAIIDQSAIPGNEKDQEKLIQKLITNRKLHTVVVAIENGYKIYGLSKGEREQLSQKLMEKNIDSYLTDDGQITVTNSPIHVSGHAYQEDIREIVAAVNADINHGTHSNDPANTAAFELEVCDPLGLKSTSGQYKNHETLQIEIGDTPEKSTITSLGKSHTSLILYKLIRQFGDFFGGSIEAKRVVKMDGEGGFDDIGLTAGGSNEEFNDGVIAVDFGAASRARESSGNFNTPGKHQQSQPVPMRRYYGREKPVSEGGLDADLLREMVLRRVTGKGPCQAA